MSLGPDLVSNNQALIAAGSAWANAINSGAQLSKTPGAREEMARVRDALAKLVVSARQHNAIHTAFMAVRVAPQFVDYEEARGPV